MDNLLVGFALMMLAAYVVYGFFALLDWITSREDRRMAAEKEARVSAETDRQLAELRARMMGLPRPPEWTAYHETPDPDYHEKEGRLP